MTCWFLNQQRQDSKRVSAQQLIHKKLSICSYESELIDSRSGFVNKLSNSRAGRKQTSRFVKQRLNKRAQLQIKLLLPTRFASTSKLWYSQYFGESIGSSVSNVLVHPNRSSISKQKQTLKAIIHPCQSSVINSRSNSLKLLITSRKSNRKMVDKDLNMFAPPQKPNIKLKLNVGPTAADNLTDTCFCCNKNIHPSSSSSSLITAPEFRIRKAISRKLMVNIAEVQNLEAQDKNIVINAWENSDHHHYINSKASVSGRDKYWSAPLDDQIDQFMRRTTKII